jgi:hypothetical protein
VFEAVLVVPTVCDANVSWFGLMLAVGANPVPTSEISCGLPDPVSVTARFAVRVPPALGVNVTLTVQLAPALNALGQLLISAKLEESGPVTLIALIFKDAFPVLTRVTTL